MKSVRDVMRDPRAAAVVGALAVLLVGHRVYRQVSGPGAAPPATGPGEPADTGASAGLALSAEGSGAAAAGDLAPSASGVGSAGGARPPAAHEVSWSWDRNPFLSAEGTSLLGSSRGEDPARRGQADSSIALRGTVVSDGKGVAILWDRLVPEGGTVKGWTVERIEPYRVVVRQGTESRTLELFRTAPPTHPGRRGE